MKVSDTMLFWQTVVNGKDRVFRASQALCVAKTARNRLKTAALVYCVGSGHARLLLSFDEILRIALRRAMMLT